MTVDIWVFGKVQGVGFRYYAKKMADELMVSGIAENMSDNTVHIIAEGDDNSVESFIDLVTQGPRDSVVQKITVKPSGFKNFKEFKILK